MTGPPLTHFLWDPELLTGWDAERVLAALPGGRPEHAEAARRAAWSFVLGCRWWATRDGEKADAAALAPLAAALADAERAFAALPQSARHRLDERLAKITNGDDWGDGPIERALVGFNRHALAVLLPLLRVAASMPPQRGAPPDTSGRIFCYEMLQIWQGATGSLPLRGPVARDGGASWDAFRTFLSAAVDGLPEAERPRRSLEGIAARTAQEMAQAAARTTPAQNP